MKKIFIYFIVLLTLLSSVFAIVVDTTFHSKFDKENTTNLNFNGFPAHSFKQHETNFSFIRDTRKDENTYTDAKREYNKQRKGTFSSSYVPSKYEPKFEKKFRDNEYKQYKRDFYSSNKDKINLFKQKGLRFKSSENYQRNNY